MSDEFKRLAREEIQTELENLKNILLTCTSDNLLYEKSKNIETNMHKIKGLAPMMGQEEVGEIAHISDIILKNVIKNGQMNGSHRIISEAIQKMTNIFSGQISLDMNGFKHRVQKEFPNLFEP